jgi:O-antigen/teichoic acid export membrane protein
MSSKLPSTGRSRILAVAATAMNRAVMVVGPLVLVPLFIRHLSPAEYGIWITALSVTSYLGLVNLGIAQVVINVVTREHAQGSVAQASGMASTGFFLYAGLCALACVAVSIAVMVALAHSGSDKQVAYLTVWILATCFLFAVPVQLFLGALRGTQRVIEEQSIWAFCALARFFATAAALLAGFKLLALAAVHGVMGMLPGWIAYFRLRRVERELDISWNAFDGTRVGEVLRPSAWYVVLQLAGLLVWGIDAAVIAWSLGPAAVPGYVVPLQLTLALLAAASIVTNAFQPRIVASISTARHDESRRTYLDLLSVSMTFAAGACVAVWIGGRPALELWAGPLVVPDVPTMTAMGALLALQCWLVPADSVLVGSMRHRRYALMSIVEGVLNLVGSILLVQHMGALGVIVATLIARLVTNGWYLQLRAAGVVSASVLDVAGVTVRHFVGPVALALALAYLLHSWTAAGPLMIAFLCAAAALLLALASSIRVLSRLFGSRAT